MFFWNYPKIIRYSCQAGITWNGTTCDCQSGWIKFDNSCYLKVDTALTFDSAQIDCVNKNARLTSVTSEGEYNFIMNLISGQFYYVWICFFFMTNLYIKIKTFLNFLKRLVFMLVHQIHFLILTVQHLWLSEYFETEDLKLIIWILNYFIFFYSWTSGEPNNAGGSSTNIAEGCGEITIYGYYDVPCTLLRNYICEIKI